MYSSQGERLFPVLRLSPSQGPGRCSGLPPTSPPPGPPLTRRRQHPGIGARVAYPWGMGLTLPVFSLPSSLPPSSQDSDLPPHGGGQFFLGTVRPLLPGLGRVGPG